VSSREEERHYDRALPLHHRCALWRRNRCARRPNHFCWKRSVTSSQPRQLPGNVAMIIPSSLKRTAACPIFHNHISYVTFTDTRQTHEFEMT